MKVAIHFMGFSKSSEIPEPKTSVNKFTDFIGVPVDLSFTAACLVKRLRKQLRTYSFPVVNFLSTGHDVVDLRRAVEMQLNKLLVGADRENANKSLRVMYGDDIFACGEPVALYRIEFTTTPVVVELHDTVPTLE